MFTFKALNIAMKKETEYAGKKEIENLYADFFVFKNVESEYIHALESPEVLKKCFIKLKNHKLLVLLYKQPVFKTAKDKLTKAGHIVAGMNSMLSEDEYFASIEYIYLDILAYIICITIIRNEIYDRHVTSDKKRKNKKFCNKTLSRYCIFFNKFY